MSNGAGQFIEYWAEDNVGNVEDVNGPEYFDIDKDDPNVAEITRPETGIYWRDNKIWPRSMSILNWSKSWIIREITVAVDAFDSISGVEDVEFYIDNDTSPIYTDALVPYEWVWDERVFGTHTIHIIVSDIAGNTKTDSIEIWIFNLNLLG